MSLAQSDVSGSDVSGSEGDGSDNGRGAPRSGGEIALRALRLATVVFTVVGGMLLLWSASTPHGSFLHLLAGLGSWGLAAVGWILGAGIVGWKSMQGQPTPPWGWLVVSATLVVATVGVRLVDLPLEARFAHSRGAFEEIAAQAHPDLPPEQVIEMEVERNARVGSYHVIDAQQQGDAVLLQTKGGFIDYVGFAYLPSGTFPELYQVREEPAFRRISGDWYVWSSGW